jgi:hypothetical protein
MDSSFPFPLPLFVNRAPLPLSLPASIESKYPFAGLARPVRVYTRPSSNFCFGHHTFAGVQRVAEAHWSIVHCFKGKW